MKLIFDRYQFV